MADRLYETVFSFQGGLATDLAPQVRQLNFLSRAENLLYEVSGAVRKAGGSARVNSSALAGAPSILGMFDFWRSGTTGSSTQMFVVCTSDSKVYSETTMNGTYTNITGTATITANAIPIFCVARDLLTIWFSTNDTPLKYNQTGNVASLGGSPPPCRGAVFHANRVWAFGRNSLPSRLYYSSSTDAEDWSGADTGSIDIDPEDGDRIVGAVPYKNDLILFKGPYKGSIHRISGRTVSTFARDVIVRGIALQTHNSIVPVMDDVWFQSDQGIHSLEDTQRYGNYAAAFLSRYLTGFFRNNVNRNRFNTVWTTNYQHKGTVVWTMSAIGTSTNNLILGLSYIRKPEEGLKFFTWTGRSCQSSSIRINPTTNLRELVFGDNAGFVNRQDVSARNINGSTAYTMRITTPQIVPGIVDSQGKQKADQPVTLQGGYLRSFPVGNYNVVLRVTRDSQTSESYNFNQGSAGFILGTDRLGTGTLGGGNLQVAAADILGECRSFQLDFQQGGLNQDAYLYEFGMRWTPIGRSDSVNVITGA